MSLFFSFQITGAGMHGMIGGKFPVNNHAELKAGLKSIEKELAEALDLAKAKDDASTNAQGQSRRKKVEELPMRKRFGFLKTRSRRASLLNP